MLYLPIRFIKDAARSVKGICKEEFNKVKDSALTELLGIPALIVTMFALRREGDHEVLHLWCVHRKDIAICPRCRAISDNVHDEEERCIRHLDIWGKKTFLHFLSRRFKCDQCGKPFTEELPFVEALRRQTIALERHIYELCKSGNRKNVAGKVGLSQSTVRDIFKRWARAKVALCGDIMTRVLGIDEVSLKKRHKQYALVIKAIRFVSIDMWAPYAQAVRNKLRHAKIVVDRFHVMKQLNDRLGKIRTRIQRNADDEVKKILKGSRWLLVRNGSELSSREEQRLREVLDSCPELRTVYLLKEEFMLIFEKVNTRDKAQRYLRAWRLKALSTGNRFLAKFVKTLENWWKEILNYFLEGITNGFVEGLNGAIRNIIRRAFGYRNFQDFRLQVFAEQEFGT